MNPKREEVIRIGVGPAVITLTMQVASCCGVASSTLLAEVLGITSTWPSARGMMSMMTSVCSSS